MRLASQIVSGIGFIGAGVIFRRKDDDVIYGLTTAAIVWTAAGFGIAIGTGHYLEVLIGLALVFLVINFLPYAMRKIGPSSLKEEKVYLVVSIDENVVLAKVVDEIADLMIRVENVKLHCDHNSQQIGMFCFFEDETKKIYSKYEKIKNISGVNKLEITRI